MAKTTLLFLSGLLFGGGLVVSGMINPEKVLGFLDVAGAWDPSLAFVMTGAVIVNFIGHRLVTGRARPVFAEGFSLPTRHDLDSRLIAGAGLFGVGWGLVGLCPGPAIAALAVTPEKMAGFVAAMLVGMLLGRQWVARKGKEISHGR